MASTVGSKCFAKPTDTAEQLHSHKRMLATPAHMMGTRGLVPDLAPMRRQLQIKLAANSKDRLTAGSIKAVRMGLSESRISMMAM